MVTENDWEKAIVISNQDNTDVYVNGPCGEHFKNLKCCYQSIYIMNNMYISTNDSTKKIICISNIGGEVH